MQPGEANRFSTHNRAGAGAQEPVVSSSPNSEPQRPTPDASDRVGYLMVLPYPLHITVFLGYPLAFAFVLIFHRWNIYTPMKWVGLGNLRLLLTDPLVWRALGNTLYFLVIHIPLQ